MTHNIKQQIVDSYFPLGIAGVKFIGILRLTTRQRRQAGKGKNRRKEKKEWDDVGDFL